MNFLPSFLPGFLCLYRHDVCADQGFISLDMNSSRVVRMDKFIVRPARAGHPWSTCLSEFKASKQQRLHIRLFTQRLLGILCNFMEQSNTDGSGLQARMLNGNLYTSSTPDQSRTKDQGRRVKCCLLLWLGSLYLNGITRHQ